MRNILTILALISSLNLWGSTVLFVGDSHSVGPFGWALDQHLRNEGHEVSTYASCGSIGKWWVTGQVTPCGYFSRTADGVKVEATVHPTPILSNLIAEIRPQIVIIELGGNYLKLPNDDFVIKDIQSMVQQVLDSGSRCFWITNPDSRANRAEIPRISKLIKKAIGTSCPIFESYLVTRYPEVGGDGIHYWSPAGTPIAIEWARLAFEAVKKVDL